jgi:predicted transcriptional regulator
VSGPPRRALKLALIAIGLLVMVGAVGAWRIFRVDDVPDELPPMERSPDDIRLASMTDAPDLALADLRGKTVFLVVVGAQSGKNREGQPLNRALNRWIYPESTVGFIVADAEGVGFLAGMVEDYVQFFAKESRFPIYVDFEGVTIETFQLTKGHHGFAVIGPDGQVLERRSGGMEGADLEELRELLGAKEPPEPAPAPAFSVGGLDNSSCSPRACAIVFLGAPVKRTQIPGIEDGFDGEHEEAFALLSKPEVRLAATALKMDLQGAPGVLVGDVEGLRELPDRGFTHVADAPEARAAFGLEPTDTAMVIVDAQGRLAFRRVGFIPMYEWGTAADLLGAEVMPEEDD